MSEIIVSEAKLQDAEKIGEIAFQSSLIHYKSVDNEFKEPSLHNQISYIKNSIIDKDILVLSAELDGKIAGYVVVYFNTYPEEYFKFHKRGFIGSIGVDENCRGHGVGKALLNGVESELKKRNILIIEIDVYSFNQTAEKLYDKLGYKDIKHYKRKFIK